MSLGNDGDLPPEKGDNQQCSAGHGLWSSTRRTPVVASKPLLRYVAGAYSLLRPPVVYDLHGPPSYTDGTSIGSDAVHFAVPGETADALNKCLSNGQHIVFTPGIYDLAAPLIVRRSGIVLLGLGLATLRPTAGTAAVRVAVKAVGVRIAGLLIEAGAHESPELLTVGSDDDAHTQADALFDSDSDSETDEQTVVSDVFCRVGGPTNAVAAHTMVGMHQNNAIIDNMWLWRADHNKTAGSGLGPTQAPCQHVGSCVAIYCRALALPPIEPRSHARFLCVFSVCFCLRRLLNCEARIRARFIQLQIVFTYTYVSFFRPGRR
jgi:hypothetical protein